MNQSTYLCDVPGQHYRMVVPGNWSFYIDVWFDGAENAWVVSTWQWGANVSYCVLCPDDKRPRRI